MRTCVCIMGDCSRQTDPRGSSPGGGHSEGRHIHHGAQQLRLCDTRVSHHEAVDVSTEMRPVRQVALSAQCMMHQAKACRSLPCRVLWAQQTPSCEEHGRRLGHARWCLPLQSADCQYRNQVQSTSGATIILGPG